MVQTAPNPNHAGTPAPLTTEAEPSAPAADLPPRVLDEAGRCCGRKPHPYRRPHPRGVCLNCGAQYSADGAHEPNWAWSRSGTGFRVTYPRQEPWRTLLLGNSAPVMTPAEAFCAPDVSDEVPGMNP